MLLSSLRNLAGSACFIYDHGHDNRHILNNLCEAPRVVTMNTCFLYEMNANYLNLRPKFNVALLMRRT